MIKVNNLELISQDDLVMSNIWEMLLIIKSENFLTGDYYVLLFLISVYKDDLITLDLSNKNQNLKEVLIKDLYNSENDLKIQYSQIYKSFIPRIEELSDEVLWMLLDTLTTINKDYLKVNFPIVFDSVLNRIYDYQGKNSSEFILPIELTRFMCGLTKLNKDAKIFNPFAGTASFGFFLEQGQYYYGQELNKNTWALGVLRLMAYNRFDCSRYICDDSISNWPNQDEKFDLIISNPPFGMRLGHQHIDIEPSIRTIEQFLIEKGVQSLTQNGKLIALLPNGFLYKGGEEQRLRERLVEADLIDTIVSLPGGLLSNTSIPLIILVLNKSKQLRGAVNMIDATSFVVENKPNESVLNDDLLQSFIQTNSIDEDIIRIVENNTIRENDYNLNVTRYFVNHIVLLENEKLVELGDIVELVRGQRGNLPEKGKLVRIGDLKDDVIDFTIDVSKVEELELKRQDIKFLTESCLLFAMVGKKLKPTSFKFINEPILLGPNILSFKIKVSKTKNVDLSYLINELHADYVQEQINNFLTGAAIPFLRKDDLLTVRIKLPILAEQKAKVEGVKQAFIKAKEDELLLHREILGIKEDAFKEFASIKHTFRQYLGAIKSNVAGTKKFLSNKSGQIISLDDIYSIKLNQTLEEHLKSLEDTITSLSLLLENEKYTSNKVDLESLDLRDLVYLAQHRFKQDDFKFDFYFDELSFNDDGSILVPLIDINKEDFLKIFSNIVSNAISHGFKTKHGNIIRSIIKYDISNEYCVLEVSNNGVHIPEKFTLKHLTTRGEKTTDSKGSGIGGADIKDIVSTYKGQFELINDLNSLFPVTYKISFPISKNN